jgi:hypothetical protein
MKTPFYDRPWLTYAKGPFVIGGAKSSFVLDANGGGITKAIDTFSIDGLNYSDASDWGNDESKNPTGKATIPVVPNAAADWWQPHPWANTIPLNAGGVLRTDGNGSCPVARLQPSDGTWQCVRLNTALRGVVRQDSRGYLTEVYASAGGLQLQTSRNGGRTWSSPITLAPPAGAGTSVEAGDLFNMAVNGRLKQAAISARFDDAKGNGHDMVFRVDESRAQPRLLRTYLLGKGDANTANGLVVPPSPRFDYETVGFFSDGKIVAELDDSTTKNPLARDPNNVSPELAILL